jgi:hypothetical protein
LRTYRTARSYRVAAESGDGSSASRPGCIVLARRVAPG